MVVLIIDYLVRGAGQGVAQLKKDFGHPAGCQFNVPVLTDVPKRKIQMLILIIILVVVLGGGGGYYGHSQWGYGGGAGVGLGTILLILLIAYMLGVFH